MYTFTSIIRYKTPNHQIDNCYKLILNKNGNFYYCPKRRIRKTQEKIQITEFLTFAVCGND